MGLKKALFCLVLLATSVATQAKDIVLATMEYPPHYGHKLDNYGPLIEIAVTAYAEQNLNVEIIFLPWSRALIWANEGRVDGILGGWHTNERAKSFLYSQPIYPNEMVFYKSKSANIDFSSYGQLAAENLVIGSVRGYVHVKGLEESGVTIHYVNNDVQNFRLLERKRVDLVAVDRDYANYVLAMPELAKIKDQVEPINRVLEIREQYLMISKKAKRANLKVSEFNQGLAKLRAKKGVELIMKKHNIVR